MVAAGGRTSSGRRSVPAEAGHRVGAVTRGGGLGALGGGLGPPAAGDEREGDHMMYPTTLRPRKPVPGEKLLRIGFRRMERDDVDAVIEQWDRERPDLDSSPIGIVGRVPRL